MKRDRRLSSPTLIRLAEDISTHSRPTSFVRENLGLLVRTLNREGGVFDRYTGHNDVKAEQTSQGNFLYRDKSGKPMSMEKIYDWLKTVVLWTYKMSLSCYSGDYGAQLAYIRKCALEHHRVNLDLLPYIHGR